MQVVGKDATYPTDDAISRATFHCHCTREKLSRILILFTISKHINTHEQLYLTTIIE